MAYPHDTVAIQQILEQSGLSPRDDPKPPPAAHEVVEAVISLGDAR